MSFLGRLVPHFVNSLQRNIFTTPRLCFHSLTQEAAAKTSCAIPGGSFAVSVRNNIRCHFPRPSERKRVKRHGYWQRMSTPGGRKILMRRILKGRFVYTH